jgi:hypothetical protein
MMPPPITSSRSGTSRSSSAPVDVMIRGSSGSPGSRAELEPAAMMQLSNETVVSPSSPATSRATWR